MDHISERSKDFDRRVHFANNDTFVENDELDKVSVDVDAIEAFENSSSERVSDVLSKADLIQINRGWNDRNERMIISIGENAASYKWMHERSSGYHKVINNTTNLLLIVLSAILSADTIVPNICQSGDSVIYILRLTIVYLITFTSIVQNFAKSQEMSEKHSAAALQFSRLYHDIQQQMCRFRRDRPVATRYVSDCLKRYDSLVINNPDINAFVLWRFKNTFRNTDIAVPDIADKIQKIEIITESPQQQIYQNNNSRMIHQDKSINNVDTLKPTPSNSCNNLVEISNAFQIHGDISDRDLQLANPDEIQRLKATFLQNRSDYEYQRYLQHSQEDD